MPKKKKAAILAIFLLVSVTIGVALVRAVTATKGIKTQMDLTWWFFWTIVELNLGIMIACVAAYRTLFGHDSSPTSPSKRHANTPIAQTMNNQEAYGVRAQIPAGGDSLEALELTQIDPWYGDRSHEQARQFPDVGITN